MNWLIYLIYFIIILLLIYSILCFVYLPKLKKKEKIPSIFPKNGLALSLLGGFLIIFSIGLSITTFLYTKDFSNSMNQIRNHKKI